MSSTFSNSAEHKQPWSRFAETDPYTYIHTGLKDRNMDEFWRSGRNIVDSEILPLLESRHVTTGCALELGCGVGRLMFPLASHFQEMWGIDVAPGMLRRGEAFALERGVCNVTFSAVARPEDLFRLLRSRGRQVDFVYSILVFQHIPDLAVIAAYLGVVSVLLSRSGLAYLQFDTRRKSLAYHLKSSLPDFLLPRFWRRGIRRIRRTPQELEKIISEAGLEIIDQLTPSTEYHRYVLRRAVGATS